MEIGDRVIVIGGNAGAHVGRHGKIIGPAVGESLYVSEGNLFRVALDGGGPGGINGIVILFRESQLAREDGGRLDGLPMSEEAMDHAIDMARAHLAGGDSPPYRSDTTTIIARALIALSKHRSQSVTIAVDGDGAGGVAPNAEKQPHVSYVGQQLGMIGGSNIHYDSLAAIRFANEHSRRESQWLEMALSMLMAMGYSPMNLRRVNDNSDGVMSRATITLDGKPVFEVVSMFVDLSVKLTARMLADWPREPKEETHV